MALTARNRAPAATHRGFTIIEMLVVISIIMILAGMLLPSLGESRRRANEVKCMSNLHQVGAAITMYAQHYGEGRYGAFPVWLTMLTTKGGRLAYLSDPRVLICPDDPSRGLEGGRPDGMRYQGTSQIIEQFEMADIDEHTGPLDGSSSRKNNTNGGINSSYIYEFGGEPCDWIYSSPPVGPGAPGSVPTQYEWQWGATPTWAQFLQLADADNNSVLSWNEVKVLSLKGTKDFALNAWDIRVPIARCYWHVGGNVLKDDSAVLDLLGDASSIHKGVPPWYK